MTINKSKVTKKLLNIREEAIKSFHMKEYDRSRVMDQTIMDLNSEEIKYLRSLLCEEIGADGINKNDIVYIEAISDLNWNLARRC